MWVARDKNGTLSLYKGKPVRGSLDKEAWVTFRKNWQCFEIDSSLFPNLTWEDEPLEIELVSKNDNVIVTKMLNTVQEKLVESVDDYFNYIGHVQDIHPYSKEQEQNYYNDMCWCWQDWNAIKYNHPSTWDFKF